MAFDATIAPTFLDPSESPGVTTPSIFLYALHDALFKPLPENPMAPSLAEFCTESPDGLVYEFKLREGVTFHNGDPFTAEDVQFSFLRDKGVSAKPLHKRVKAINIIDPYPGSRARDPCDAGPTARAYGWPVCGGRATPPATLAARAHGIQREADRQGVLLRGASHRSGAARPAAGEGRRTTGGRPGRRDRPDAQRACRAGGRGQTDAVLPQ